jgi:hypothetical protein
MHHDRAQLSENAFEVRLCGYECGRIRSVWRILFANTIVRLAHPRPNRQIRAVR